MSVFLSVAALLIAVTLFWLARLWTKAPPAAAQNFDPEWQVMLARRDEIERDLNLDAATRATLREEWLRSADAVVKPAATATGSVLPSGTTLSALAFGLVLVALITYGAVGTWDSAALRLPASIEQGEAARSDVANFDAGMAERMTQLEARLKKNPDDLDGWRLLARSRFFARDYAGAAAALESALKIAPRNASVLADLADSLAASSGTRSLAGRPISLVREALKVDSRHPKSLALAATHAMEVNDRTGAITYWQRLRAELTDDPEGLQQIDAVLASLGAKAATPKSTRAASKENAAIAGTVRLSPELLQAIRDGKLPANAVLFVLAKSANGTGGPPLAAVRMPLTQIQAANPFTLDDSLAINPANTLSMAKSVDIEARIAMSGSVQRQADDVVVIVQNIAPGKTGLDLKLERP